MLKPPQHGLMIRDRFSTSNNLFRIQFVILNLMEVNFSSSFEIIPN